jgi:hypothetical protein
MLILIVGCSGAEQPAAPAWDVQVDSARAAAHAIDADALLIEMSAIPARWHSDEDTVPTMRCTWVFLAPATGEIIGVRFEDTAITDTIETHVNTSVPDMRYYPYPLLPAEQKHLEEAVHFIDISPANAYKRATQDGLFFGERDSFVGILLFVEPTIEENLGIPAAWRVLFVDDTGAEIQAVWIDANTGAVIGHTNDRLMIPTAGVPHPTASP